MFLNELYGTCTFFKNVLKSKSFKYTHSEDEKEKHSSEGI